MADDYDIGKAFQAIENELIASMIRNMKDHKLEEIDENRQWTMWQAEQLKELEKYKHDNRKKYAGQFKDINSKIEALIIHSRAEGNMQQELTILKAIREGFKGAKRTSAGGTAEFFRLNDRKLDALIKATTNDMKKAETAVLRMADDQYRKSIFNAQVYANTGAGTYEKAVDMAVKDMLASGLNCVEYKNGARHTLADYADMAIRTASKRAYLQGEGEKRQEWGISTVIMNKRGNPCPQCLPFVGKVLIDDVYSGGAKDGKSSVTGLKYPLMSEAIASGLYHPRCKDSHTTYFEGISTPPDDAKYTKEELDQMAEDYRKEQQLQYAKRQQEKFGRLAENSLDEDNRRHYQQREQEWSRKVMNQQKEMQEGFTEHLGEPYSQTMPERMHSVFERTNETSNEPKKSVANGAGSDIMKLIKGALTDNNDPLYVKRDRHAEKFYNAIRNSKKEYFVKSIAKNSGLSEKHISKVYDHVFKNEHDLYGGKKRFDPDYDMAESFRRLREGKEIQEHDLIMLRHEHLEYGLMNKLGMSYEEAHRLAEKKYNYKKALDDFKTAKGL